MSLAVNGINIAVEDLPAATTRYERLFGVTGEHVGPEGFAFPGLEGTRLNVGGFIISLITSTQDGTSVARFLQRHGEGVFLFSAKVHDLDAATDELKQQGLIPLLDEAVRGDFGAVNFYHPKALNGVQLELIEQA
ncbi:VOC family protein [Rhodococcus fascians]|uniref:VOC family protein n=1 Tax=Nocardiaceae TaxID=85025 RepID=UPI00137B08C8|nr:MULTISPECIES: VOC family protein [Rhodococcus]MBM7244222.1 VOC family protein [Rhodococcus fascians]MBY3810422.1 VOC family protein [Rhodococcus fascians]MBY3841955.1 VOC family protein [Rhodococcus fascians]MBY3844406.1 VOC family protein [Rhodococcus fascians]MBY3850352.1 VOC family protein [Rhodococcus fascians]